MCALTLHVRALRRELLNQRLCLQHPHIVGLEEVFLTPYHLGIAMEYANGGDLSDYIADHVNRKVRSQTAVCQKPLVECCIIVAHSTVLHSMTYANVLPAGIRHRTGHQGPQALWNAAACSLVRRCRPC